MPDLAPWESGDGKYDGTYYIRVSDLRGDGRPDFIYDLSLSGAD